MIKLLGLFKENKTYTYIAIAFLIAFAFLLNVLFTIQLKFENRELNNQIAELDNRLKGSKQELQQAKTDAYIEKQATERLGMVKSGDTPIKIYIENEEEETKKKDNGENQDKVRIYVKDWYEQMSDWVNKK
ncbi:septum formation initiator family protein [Bacillus toyonensis]|uniref:FtsB family cell division protein n=1 Tax=Bacillus toyonensis TaxID=155322 RepID=UPI002E1D9768|nr:septum formation initiator family protein [Bacillus toyonensis]